MRTSDAPHRNLLAAVPQELAGRLFAKARPTRIAAGQALFVAGEPGFVSRGEFEAFAEEHPQVYKHLLTLLAQRLRNTNVVVAAASFLSLKGRVARSLLDLAEAFGHEVGAGRVLIRQKISQSDLAAMAGIARENVSRILNDW